MSLAIEPQPNKNICGKESLSKLPPKIPIAQGGFSSYNMY